MRVLIGIAVFVALVIIANGVTSREKKALKKMAAGVIILWLSSIAFFVAQSSWWLSTGICAIVFTGLFLYYRQLVLSSDLTPANKD